MIKYGLRKPCRKFSQKQKLICLLILAMIFGMFQPVLFFPQPAYAEAALPDSGTPFDLQIDDTNDEASQSELGEADAQVSNDSIPENTEAAETTDAAGDSFATETGFTFPFQFGLLSADTTIDMSEVNPLESGAGWTYNTINGVYIIHDGAVVTVTGTTTERRLEVAENATATITLDGVSITGLGAGQSPLLLNIGSNVTLILADGTTNTLEAGENRAGIEVPAGSELTIEGTGSLTATGGGVGAGIGGGSNGGSGGSVTINGGTVIAKAGNGAVAIGRGVNGGGNGTLDMSGYTLNGDSIYDYWTNTTASEEGKTPGTLPLSLNDDYKYIEIQPNKSTIDMSLANPREDGEGWAYNGGIFTILDGANVNVIGTNANQRRIEADAGATATITLKDVSITGLGDGQSPLLLGSGANVTLILAEGTTNTFEAGTNRAGIEGPPGGTLTIEGNGSLKAAGGTNGAGIGGGMGGAGGNVTIKGGTVIAMAGDGAVAINGTLDMRGYYYDYWTSATSADEEGATQGTAPLVPRDDYKYIKIAPDRTSPKPGGNGEITAENVTHNGLTLKWEAASDYTSPAENLKYYVYQSTSRMDEIGPDDEPLNPGGTVNITIYNVEGLDFNTTYYFVVVVEDEAGNKAAYTAVSATTDKLDPVVNWPENLTATYGQTLADIQLPENTGTPGTFSWEAGGSTSVGDAGERTFNLTFTPDDPANYKTVSKDVTVTVNPKSLTADMLAVQGGPFIYNGAPHTPPITVTHGGKELVLNTDYENVVYSDHTDAGTATVSITGKGNYTGTVSQVFRIDSAPLTLKADDKTIAVGEPEPVYTYTVTGLAGSDTAEEVIIEEPELGVPGFSSAAPGIFEIVIWGGTTNGNYTIANYVNGTLTVAAKRNSGGGSSGSGGGSSPDGNIISIIIIPPSPDQPSSPTKAAIRVLGTVGSDGNIIVNIPDKTVADAFEMALADAQRRGNAQNGIMLVFEADTGGKSGSHLTVHLSKAVQETIMARKIISTAVAVEHPHIQIELDLEAVEEIYRQADSDVHVTAVPIDSAKLSDEARKAIGSRPAFDLKVNVGSGRQVRHFGDGKITVTLPYTLGEKEKAGNIKAVYIDDNGKVHWLDDSVYDVEHQVLSFGTNHFSIFGVGYKEEVPVFQDIDNHWAKEDIEYVVRQGLFSGTSETTFSPDMAMTRGMFVTVIGRLAKADISGYKESGFADVKRDAYYMGYIEWARSNHIVSGVGNGRFAPDQPITREEMAVMMRNYAKAMGFTLPKVREENIFADSAQISAYAKEAVAELQMAGIVSGKNGNLFDPQGTATRAEVSAVFRRFIEMAAP